MRLFAEQKRNSFLRDKNALKIQNRMNIIYLVKEEIETQFCFTRLKNSFRKKGRKKRVKKKNRSIPPLKSHEKLFHQNSINLSSLLITFQKKKEFYF